MKKLIPWIVLGLVLRLVLIPITLHPDFRAYNLAAYLITQKGQLLTFYDYLSKLPRSDRIIEVFMDDGLFLYPPLAYLTHALFMWLLSPLYPWNTLNTLILYYDHVRTDPHLPQLLYLLKLPYLLADAAGLWLLLKTVDPKRRFASGLLWIFNPLTLYSAYMLAQFDIFIALFLLLAIYFNNRQKSTLSAIALGIAAGFKPFPLLLTPLMGETLKDKIKYIATALLTYLIIIAPYLSSPGFKQYALLANQTDKLWYAKIAISGGQSISLFLLGLAILFWYNLAQPKKLSQVGWLVAALLTFYSLVHYHVQWFTWIAPLLVLSLVSVKKAILPATVLVVCYFVIVLFSEQSLFFGLFNSSYNLAKHFLFMPADQFASLIRSIFAATSFYFVSLHEQS